MAPLPGDFWPGLAASLKGRIPMGGVYVLSQTPPWSRAGREGGVLTLYADCDFTRSMINKPGILNAVLRRPHSCWAGSTGSP